MDTFNESLGLKIPGHVAVILDGNGRWEKTSPKNNGTCAGKQSC